MAHKPMISVLMPTYNTPVRWLEEAIDSVRDQLYENWELCIADDASKDPAVRQALERAAAQDERIKVTHREVNGHISAASNSALDLCNGEWVALMDHDDLLAEHALFWVADAITRHPEARLIYSDEDKISEHGFRFEPYFKCNFNRELFYSHNMICHLGAYRRDIVKAIGGFREDFEGAQDHDLALRCIEHIEPEQIHHVPRVLYHWRRHPGSTTRGLAEKPYSVTAGVRALQEHFNRRSVAARVEGTLNGYHVRYELPKASPLVTLVIPTRNGVDLLRTCINSINEQTTYPNYDILIVDNGSDDEETLDYLRELEEQGRATVRRDHRPFNFGALNNAAVNEAKGELVALVNNDIEVITPDWLDEMVGMALQPEVGAVGAKLLYPDGKIQHAGVVLGLGGVAGHAFKQFPGDTREYHNRAQLAASYSAVTAACLVIRKKTYLDAGGFEEDNLTHAFNDVDFCMRVRQAGYTNVWTPHALLYHHESATRGHEDTRAKRARFDEEVRFMQKRWGRQLLEDPAYSRNLTLHYEDFSLAWPPRVTTA
ncbi:MAG: glycosyltransferase family 2 protein [Gammaproteobacteria bacterium]|nr:glycosyltransferase family 2 protein [Gammaproteobacteria bacterium]